MNARTPRSLLLAAALAAAPGMVLAQNKAPAAPAAPAAAPTPPSKEQVEQAAYEVRVLVSALQSDKVEGPIKDKLFECLYNNSFGKISEAVDKVIAANAGKVDKRNPDQVLGVMAGVCGYRPPAAAAAGTPAPATPAPAGAKPAAPTAKPSTPAKGR